ncbi:peptide-N-glycosidase F-related protein [Solitalea canadensis]|uniref:Peptide-N-glycosidase F, N terminal/Peptide-N-glycosidase F, C terminal n=1 Tax=Solitalea canadensis (strain ATCC 29591 / DSM 3403 / JCM 21819 / LMG 8368 / NBRC 15130 / NCIMB 12057 / USAM 9D) TaxID=929556 RepID=H8KVU2_SOLCM|nr:peptide-N-glycosidase F-related protein [Solitalea canadensis]AFD06715.1 Peptide-N-glycosidase F, N terminal/Peptide-N-glycosidase F, C terminal [Solitalea canadensis DSM 3403]
MNRFKILAVIFSICLAISFLQTKAADTTHVVTHNKTTVVTDPSKGFNTYKKWGVFPTANVPVRKIILHVKFACPDSMRCADWDYMDRISIMRTKGKNGQVQDYEIARMLTPYGGAFDKKWKFEWQVDVTDFSSLLRDSVEIEYKHTGYEPNKDRGWAITLDFEIVKGKPALEPVSIQKIYDDSFSYGDTTKPINQALKPISFKAENNVLFARLRLVQTGHGMDEPDNCAEFCNKYRQLFFDDKLIDTRAIWKKCGDNPLYPQAGTWIIDRANWCPGNLMQPDIFDLKVQSGTTHTVQAKMEDYISSKPSAAEVISAYLIQYKEITNQNDVAIEDIVVPSSKYGHKRANPAVANPKVLIKNLGKNEITNLEMIYGTEGFSKKQFKWAGKMPSGKSVLISLPGVIDAKKSTNQFYAKVVKVNGKKDAYEADNFIKAPFEAAPLNAEKLIFYLHTNQQPEHNSYALKNASGEVLQGRKQGSLKANTIYRDTLALTAGAYTLALVDTAGDGLEFWYNTAGGRGSARLMNLNGEIVKAFESDCGAGWEYNFRVGEKPDAINKEMLSVGLFPTRTNDKTTLDYFGSTAQDVTVQLVTDPGSVIVEEHKYNQLKEGIFTYDLSRFPKGRFYLKVFVNGEEKFKKRVRLKE